MSDVTKPEEEAASGSGVSSEPPGSERESSPESKVVAPPPPPPPTHRPNYVFLAAVAILSLAADLGSKWWAKANLEMPLDETHVNLPRRIDLIKGWVALVFARNKGGAWGLLQDENESVRRPFFLLISAAAIVFIVSLYRRLNPGQTALKWGLPLVLGGALGNLVDRIRYGHVVDFIDVYYKEHHWPTFNVADIAICVGVGLMAVDMFTSRKTKRAPIPAPPESDPDPPPSKPADSAAAPPAEGA